MSAHVECKIYKKKDEKSKGMKRVLSLCALLAFVSGCSSSSTDTKGRSCNNKTAQVVGEGFKDIRPPLNVSSESEEVLSFATRYKLFSSYIQELDLPSLEIEQVALVSALEKYISGIESFVTSGGLDVSVDKTVLALGDARENFAKAFLRDCAK